MELKKDKYNQHGAGLLTGCSGAGGPTGYEGVDVWVKADCEVVGEEGDRRFVVPAIVDADVFDLWGKKRRGG